MTANEPSRAFQESGTRALRPIWWLTTGIVLGALGGTSTLLPVDPILRWALAAVGLTAAGAALKPSHRNSIVLWLTVGLALGGFRGIDTATARHRLASCLTGSEAPAVRFRGVVTSGWSASRWGITSSVRIHHIEKAELGRTLPRHVRLEVRGNARPDQLPSPGTTVHALATLRGHPRSPRLVVASQRLVEELAPPRGLAAARNRAVNALLDAAGTSAGRIRSAELAGALVLGRRDLVPPERREGWRRSGFAHILAVSGLHVGLIGGAVWLVSLGMGASPRTARWIVILALPVYTVLAGASPSATRACLMGVFYLGARLIGRAVLALAPVLAAASCLLLGTPSLVTDVGFQLTVVITAALVRWVPPAVASLPGPRLFSAALVVPLIAQTAAAPIVAVHFRTLVPGAAVANLVVPFLLTPLLLIGVVTSLVAPVFPWLAGFGLDLVSGLQAALWFAGGIARSAHSVVPPIPTALAAGFVIAGWLALHAGRRARLGVAAWLILLVGCLGWWVIRPGPVQDTVRLLPVRDGLAALVTHDGTSVLIDGGRHRRFATHHLADLGVRDLTAVIASHPDEDHIGGLQLILEAFTVGKLVLPSWMLSDRGAGRLIRAAHRRGVRVVPAARGSSISLGSMRLETLWPPAESLEKKDNERSLVGRLVTKVGTVLITSDIGRATEHELIASSDLTCDVLIAPHHGSRGSSSDAFLDAALPSAVLIPAGPWNLYHHPHPEVLERLGKRRTPRCSPAEDGSCAARVTGGSWRIVP